MNEEITLMRNNKSTTPILLAVPFMLFLSAVYSGKSISADEASGKKELKEQMGVRFAGKCSI